MYYFNGVFPGGTKGLAPLIRRFFAYCLPLFIGVVVILPEKSGLRHTAGRNTNETEDS